MEELKILPIEQMKYTDYEIAIDDTSITYVQTSDCTEEEGAQSITLSTRSNGINRFLNIKTGEEGWSFCNIEDLKLIIEDFIKRAFLVTDK